MWHPDQYDDDPYNRDDISERFAETARDMDEFNRSEYEALEREEAEAWWDAKEGPLTGQYPPDLIPLAKADWARQMEEERKARQEADAEALSLMDAQDDLPF